MSNPLVVVVGAGPGLGAAIARRYGAEGYDVALVARDEPGLVAIGESLQASGITTGWSALDIRDDAALTAAIGRFGERSGRIDSVHVNPSAFRQADALTLTPDELLADLRVGVAPLLTAVQAARPYLTAGGRVTATGGGTADRPWAEAASLGVQKAALRNLVQALDQTLAPSGVRAMSLTVNGTLAADTAFSPDRVADALVRAASRSNADWTAEVPYNG